MAEIREEFLRKFAGKTFSLTCKDQYRNGQSEDLCRDSDLHIVQGSIGALVYCSAFGVDLTVNCVERGEITFSDWCPTRFKFSDDKCIVTMGIFEERDHLNSLFNKF